MSKVEVALYCRFCDEKFTAISLKDAIIARKEHEMTTHGGDRKGL